MKFLSGKIYCNLTNHQRIKSWQHWKNISNLPRLYPIPKNHSMALIPKWSRHKPVLRAPSTVLNSSSLWKSDCKIWQSGHRVVAELSQRTFWTLGKIMFRKSMKNKYSQCCQLNLSQAILNKKLDTLSLLCWMKNEKFTAIQIFFRQINLG